MPTILPAYPRHATEIRKKYGLFLLRIDRSDDALTIFADMLNEEPHLGQVEKRSNRKWLALAKNELKNISAAQKTA